MSSRSDFDGGAGADIIPASIAAQAAQLAAGRFIVRSNGNYQIDFHKKVAESYNLACKAEGSNSGSSLSHSAWIDIVMATPGGYVVTLIGGLYVHSIGIWNESTKYGLFDSEAGQYTNSVQSVFKSKIEEYFTSEYPGLASWEAYSLTKE